MSYNNIEKSDMLTCYMESGKNARAAARLYNTRYEDRQQPHFTYFRKLLKKLETYGSLVSKSRARARTVTNENNSFAILASLYENPYTSLRSISEYLDIPYTSVQRVAKRYKYHPYKSVKVQQLLSHDFERRLNFVSQMIIKLDDDPTILTNILWTDEARFHNNGQVNHHNQHYWSDINPNWALESNVQTRWSINVWCGIIDEYLGGPYFYE
ncbi:unnamed protein product [Macrosiphum euphorbiae]|uniref:DUF4817 domain-containing protein n=1 Tax=Macrosiphum euphorbiae TaxID=13131 RepID=A0AAV0XUY0_9HEMI|nr:unnamed protein product [Macrosiphum euphorbiae]